MTPRDRMPTWHWPLLPAARTAIWRLPVKTDSPAWPCTYSTTTTATLEFSELITDFTPESSASLYTKSVRVTQDKKAVYAIANYAGQSFTAAGQPVTITEQTPRSVLDALQVASATFAGNDIVMVGKKVVEMTGTAVNASIEMERLVGRLDLHVYKAAELTDDAVELVSIIFCNQVTKSNVQYQSNAMPAGDIRQTETHTPSAATLLEVVPDNTDYASRTPSDAETSFYSYQNISGATDPSEPPRTTPRHRTYW